MKEIDGDLEDLVLVYLHHHQDVSKSHMAYLYALFTSSHCLLKPVMLILKELGIEVSYSSCKYLENIPVFLLHRIQHHLHLLIVVGEGDQSIELFRDSLKHEDILPLLVLVVVIDW